MRSIRRTDCETTNFVAELYTMRSKTTVSKSAEPSMIPAMQFEDGSQLPESTANKRARQFIRLQATFPYSQLQEGQSPEPLLI